MALAHVVLRRRGWMLRAVAWLGRRLPRGRMPKGLTDDAVPPQGAMVRAYAWCVATTIASGAVIALLISALQPIESPAAAVAAFGAAWTVSFLAVPFPMGVGVREAVLIAILGGTAGAASVIAAAVAHRLVTMVGEPMLILASGGLRGLRHSG